MRPRIKIIKFSNDDKRDKKLLSFWVDPLLYDHCVRSSSCQLIKEGDLVKGDISSTEVITALAVEFWRLEKRLNKINEVMKEKVGSASEPVFDQLQRIRDFLGKHEIEIKEYDGESYNDGMAPRAIHFEKDESLPEGVMKIIETVKPTIYLKGNVVVHGEVIVARSKDA